MNDATLSRFREPASALSLREKKDIRIVTGRGTLEGVYDPLFGTVRVNGITVPEKELAFWVRAFFRATVAKITPTTQPTKGATT